MAACTCSEQELEECMAEGFQGGLLWARAVLPSKRVLSTVLTLIHMNLTDNLMQLMVPNLVAQMPAVCVVFLLSIAPCQKTPLESPDA